MSRWSPTIVKFIDLFHLCPWPTTIIERPYIEGIDNLFHFFDGSHSKYVTFYSFQYGFDSHFYSNLEFYGQDSPEIQKIPFYQICDLRISRK